MAARTHARSASGKSGENVSSCEGAGAAASAPGRAVQAITVPTAHSTAIDCNSVFPSSDQRRVHAGIHHWSDG